MLSETATYIPRLSDIKLAAKILKKVIVHTPLQENLNLSKQYKANIFLKREDLQQVRSYKIRGAYNKINSLSKEELKNGIVSASAGNHAQGVAMACSLKKINGIIFMPVTTPKQKINKVKLFGDNYITVKLVGDTFDDAYEAANIYSSKYGKVFIHPFNDKKIIEGQGTVGLEIIKQSKTPIDYLILPIGGGGLASGISSVFKTLLPKTTIIGVQPLGAPSMQMAVAQNNNIKLDRIDPFVDGAAVKQAGSLTYKICAKFIDKIITVPEGKICQTILELYNHQAIVVEPAGALTISALDILPSEIKGKNVVCILSGSNNDITRTAEIKERALLYSGLKHYFIINFPQRSGALKEFVMHVLGENDDITFFEYSKKTSRDNAPAVVGIELQKPSDLQPLIKKMKALKFYGEYINDKPNLFNFLV